MRCNQVSISIERFGKYVPENYPADVQKIHVYCDDFNSVYAALSKAYALAINELAEYESIGCRTDVYTNEFSRADYREMNGILPLVKRKYEDDINLQYYDTDLQLCKDRIWVYENADAILEVLRECDDADSVVPKLKERFNLDDYQIRKLSQMRMDMLTKEEYLDAKEKVKMKEASLTREEQHELYNATKRRKLQQEISKLKAYFVVADHYEEIMKMVTEMDFSEDFEKEMQKRFGFDGTQTNIFKYFSLNEFSLKERKNREEQLERLEEMLDWYKE